MLGVYLMNHINIILMKAPIVTGSYSRKNYEVFLIQDGEIIDSYSGDNITSNGNGIVSLSKMREYCENTAKDFAAENGAVLGEITFSGGNK